MEHKNEWRTNVLKWHNIISLSFQSILIFLKCSFIPTSEFLTTSKIHRLIQSHIYLSLLPCINPHIYILQILCMFIFFLFQTCVKAIYQGLAPPHFKQPYLGPSFNKLFKELPTTKNFKNTKHQILQNTEDRLEAIQRRSNEITQSLPYSTHCTIKREGITF